MFDREKIKLGITPTGWTNDDFPLIGNDICFEQVVSEMALAGYEGCSVGHNFPKDPDEIRAALELRGLSVSEPWASAFFTVEKMGEKSIEEFRRQSAFIKSMGGTDIGLAELGHSVHQRPIDVHANRPIFDDGQWKAMVDGLQRLGEIAVEEDMKLCYHHHMGTGVMVREQVDRLMADTDPALVHLLFDTGHIYWAGDDPLALARDHGDRIAHVHLKDIRRDRMEANDARGGSFEEGVRSGVFTVPGDGDIDFKPIFQALADAGFEGWMVVEAEQDPAMAHPLTYAMKARKYIRETAGI